MAVDAFIWFKNASGGGLTPEGETTDAFFSKEKAFGINDFTFGVENATTIGSATGGAGAGKVKFNEFTIRRTTDQSSPVLFKNCCVGAHYESVIIAMFSEKRTLKRGRVAESTHYGYSEGWR